MHLKANMDKKTAIPVLLLLFLLFVAFGDFLPPPLSTASLTTRTALNQFIVALFPNWQPQDPNRRTEKAVEETETEASGNKK